MNDGLGIGVMSSVNFKERYTACELTWLKDFDNTFSFIMINIYSYWKK